jgi:hypothetical protein
MMLRLTIAGGSAWKAGLIPVLAVVLFKVTRPSTSDVDLPEAHSSAPTPGVSPPTATRPAPVLPELSLAEALKFNPFASLPMPERPVVELPMVVEAPVTELDPEASQPAAPVVNPLLAKAASLRSLKVSAVFPSSKGSVAIIDAKPVRVGELLSPGVRVVEIRGTEVILRVEDGESGAGAEPGSVGLH